MLTEFTRYTYSRNTYGYPAYRLTPVIGGEEASMAAKKPVHLGVLGLAPGAHQAAWRHPNCAPHGHVDLNFFRRLVETAERAKFDFLFLADLVGPIGADQNTPDVFERTPYGLLEPMTLSACGSPVTD